MSTIRGGRYYTSYEDPILPSQTSEVWLQFDNPHGTVRVEDKEVDTLTGKWLIHKTPEVIDTLWPKLKERIQANRLGISMKATTPVNPGREGQGLICIYTRDWQDIEDVRRVVAELRTLGITDKLYYKADAQTLLGISGSIYCSPHDAILELTAKGRQWYKENAIPFPTSLYLP